MVQMEARLPVKPSFDFDHGGASSRRYLVEGIIVKVLVVARDAPRGILDLGLPDRTMADRKSTRLNSSHITRSRMPSSA